MIQSGIPEEYDPVKRAMKTSSRPQIDFFISYTSSDEAWAEWIGWILEAEGYSVKVQAWDFAAGINFVLAMHQAAEEAARTIAVLSADYLKSTFAAPEWAAAFAKDPQGLKQSLVPVRVQDCTPSGLLKAIVYIDLVDREEKDARTELLKRLSGERGKPKKKPDFPGRRADDAPPFPGGRGVPAQAPGRFMPDIRRTPSDLEKRRFLQSAFDALVEHFGSCLEELKGRESSVEYEFKEITATKYTAEIFIDGNTRAHCKFWMDDRRDGDGIKFSDAAFVSDNDDSSFNEMLSLNSDELSLRALMGNFGGRDDEGLNPERLSAQDAAEFLWRRFVERV